MDCPEEISLHCPVYSQKGIPTISSSDCHVHLFRGPVVWSVFSSDGPATCMRERYAAWDGEACMTTGWAFKKSCILWEYLENSSWCFLCRKYVLLGSCRHFFLHSFSQSQ